MATLASNDVYLEIDGVDVSAYFTAETSREVSANQNEVTAGAGTDWVMNSPGLFSYKMSLTLVYDVGTFQSVLQPKLATGLQSGFVIKYGPEGQTVGKPKDELKVNLDAVKGPNIAIGKDMVTVELSFVNGNVTPVAVIELGGVF